MNNKRNFLPKKPWRVSTINIFSAFVFGLIMSSFKEGVILQDDSPFMLFVSIGFLGSFSTFSTFVVDILGILMEHRWIDGLSLLIGTLVGGIFAVALGYQIGYG